MEKYFASRFKNEFELRHWVISFYERQIENYIQNMGEMTAYKVRITPKVLGITLKRYLQLVGDSNVVYRRLLRAN